MKKLKILIYCLHMETFRKIFVKRKTLLENCVNMEYENFIVALLKIIS